MVNMKLPLLDQVRSSRLPTLVRVHHNFSVSLFLYCYCNSELISTHLPRTRAPHPSLFMPCAYGTIFLIWALLPFWASHLQLLLTAYTRSDHISQNYLTILPSSPASLFGDPGWEAVMETVLWDFCPALTLPHLFRGDLLWIPEYLYT